ncbi:CRISPR-associated helicase Cas3' [Halomonas piscis]|uniref:CRISPR-associated helicase Cas3 n=1 Tax=Halomonas piscis TaxID=3031727 RepID=A0ABY9Z0C6_9GAMM|nr:CRISPR-associated helicase Cas3' [Halomonas piscis]WNK20567.1 CRISPR-associated helicase Cas3' [Halomonas piscis]
MLPYHSLDVAAVGWCLLAPDTELTRQLAARLGLEPEALRQLLVFWLGVHDLGKFSRAFQGLFQPSRTGLVPIVNAPAYTERHDCLGAVLWQENWIEWLRDGTLQWPSGRLGREQRHQLSETLSILSTPFFGHHGKPVESGQCRGEQFFISDDVVDDTEAARQFIADWADIVSPVWAVDKLTSPEWRGALQALSWTVAGWATLSDWLGSSREYFPYCQKRVPLAEYWPLALSRARAVLEGTGFASRPQALPYRGMDSWFGGATITPTPLQKAAEELVLSDGPQLCILEDVTGAGKTEAAGILTQRLLVAGHGDGLYFALPTMATSNAMYSRMGKLHRHFFTADSSPSLVLSHGARDLNDEFMGSLEGAQPEDGEYAANDMTASSRCNRWLADSRKKALLADVGVGTIDQVLMALLPFRHQSLRLYGLARKVLVVDEVHAYDHYMQGLLGQLLTHHARQGGSAILLTATLPLRMRDELLKAWQEGLNAEPQGSRKQEFPLLTHAGIHGVTETPLATRPEVVRSVNIGWLTDEEQCVDSVLAAVERGECVAWVRNTVDDAIRAFEAIEKRHPDAARCLLFHSRFAMCDRQRIEADVIQRLGKHSTPDTRRGQVLISTQVFQESLDCDVDLMISDIAPIDLLIQRAGRLQRHARGPRRKPLLQVLAPEWTEVPDAEWLQRVLPGTQAVYRDTSLIWLTQRVLRETGVLRMPNDARHLLESVYGAVIDLVPDALQDARFEQKGMQKMAASMANFNALRLEDGYVSGHQWQEEQEIGTRLIDEPTVNVALLTRTAEDGLQLWAGGERHAAMLSQAKLRQSQAEKLAMPPARYQPQWEALQEQHKALHYTRPWLVEADESCTYDQKWGLRLGV